ncbi:hypothetical protein ACQKGI_20165 [Peribacillus muralis]|uniref:hypothetical protein n=1 Tax=Peribacillus muralis TaxID=264697 RepID=UPI003821F0A0
MDFQKEYNILKSLNSIEILEISFIFNEHKIKIFFTQRKDYEFLVLICENAKFSFVKNFGIYFSNDLAKINGYWGKYFSYANGLKNELSSGFSEFYQKLKQSIQSVKDPNDEFTITYHQNEDGIDRIRKATNNSAIPGDAIYFNHIRRRPITSIQFKKVSDTLGKDAATYLKDSDLTAVFTPDITKQKSFILAPHEDND